MKKKLVWALVFVAVTCLIVLAYQLLWGKLFPFGPLALGFTKHELPHTIIYVQDGAEFNGFERVDTLIPGVERFHDLLFSSKPALYVFRDSANYAQRSLSKARFCAFYNGSIVISPWALREDKEGTISLDTYLTHELSHSLLFQQAGMLRSWRLPEWWLEGVATYSANQFGTSWYPSRRETYDLIRQGNFMLPEDYGSDREDGVRLDVPYRITFIYSEFGCMIDYLVESYGRDKFERCLKAVCEDSDLDRVFRDVYGVSVDSFVRRFREHVME